MGWGKRQLLPQLRRFVPPRFEQYFEPCLGSGALFFDLAASPDIALHTAWLTDLNRDLLGCYCAVGAHADDVIAALADHERQHRESPQTHFYRVRDTLFNPQRSEHFGASPSVAIEDYPPALAAMFIYLNRTGFNGLFRLNSRSEFNVPAGRYANPRICAADNLRAVASLIGAPGVNIRYGGFELALEHARRHDLLYFDPPYAPVSDTANFTGYTASRFSSEDQTAAAAGRHRARRPRMSRDRQQFDRSDHQRALRDEPDGAPRRTPRASRAGATRHQFEGQPPRRRRGVHHQ